MLDVKKTAVFLDESDVLDLERIVVDADSKDALRFLKNELYDRILAIQRSQ